MPALLCMALLTGACMKGPVIVCHPNYFQAMGKEAVDGEIIRLETILAGDPDNLQLSASYFYLALLHAHYDNPAPDYVLSLNLFEKYLLLNPESPRRDEARYVQALVREQVDSDRQRTLREKENAELKRNNIQLKEENEQLAVENKNLTDAIEKLKLLDFSLEEKRLKF